MSRRILTALIIVAMAVFFAGIAPAQDMKTITGTLVSQDQLQADDGQVYMIENTGAAQDLDQMVDKKVTVKGTVMEKEGKNVIQLDSIEPAE